MPAKAWTKWFWSDWRGDNGLQMCSLAARGLWMDMLSICAEEADYGYLRRNGVAVTPQALARLVGATLDEVVALLSELEINGVFSRNKAGVIYCRRMVKEENLRRIGRENGKMGGNPSLLKQKEKSQGVNPSANTQIPEARNQIGLEKDPEGVTPTETEGTSSTGVALAAESGVVRLRPEAEPNPAPAPRAVATPVRGMVLDFGKPPEPPDDLTSRGTRIPPNWWITEREGLEAMRRGFTADEVRSMARAFKAHFTAATGARAVKKSWRATWAKWVEKEAADRRAREKRIAEARQRRECERTGDGQAARKPGPSMLEQFLREEAEYAERARRRDG